MRVVALILPLALLLSGCSMGSVPLTSALMSGGEETSVAGSTESKLGWDASGDTSPSVSTAKTIRPRVATASAAIPVEAVRPAADSAARKLDPEAALGTINAYRAEHGLKPLSLDAKLTLAAKEHSRDLAKNDRISHYGADGSTPWDRVRRTGYHAQLAAENVGTGQATFEEVLKGWKESEGHNKNLLVPDARHMGIALVEDPKSEFKTFWTLVIAKPM